MIFIKTLQKTDLILQIMNQVDQYQKEKKKLLGQLKMNQVDKS